MLTYTANVMWNFMIYESAIQTFWMSDPSLTYVQACEEAHDRLRHQGLQDGVMDIVFAWDVPDNPLPPGPFPPTKSVAGSTFYLTSILSAQACLPGGLNFVTGKVMSTKIDLSEDVAVAVDSVVEMDSATGTNVTVSLMTGKEIGLPPGTTGGVIVAEDTMTWVLAQIQGVDDTTGIMDMDHRADLPTTD